jgi:hypothetical protein
MSNRHATPAINANRGDKFHWRNGLRQPANAQI